jgi:hypothetical protein
MTVRRPRFDETRIEHRMVDGRPAVVYEAIRYTSGEHQDPGKSKDRLDRGLPRPRVTASDRPRVAVSVSRRSLTGLAGVFLGAYSLAIRPRVLRWGATDEEIGAVFPGADLVPGAKRTATMAITIDAPPSRVWPWLAQMGCDRAGWYSWDRLDNAGVASAREIRPEWQHIDVGDHIASTPSGSSWFEVAAAEPERFLALRARLDLRGRPFDASDPQPRHYVDSLWGFLLNEMPGKRTRLVVSGYAASKPRLLGAIGDFLWWEPAHWMMQTRQFANLKQRAERNADGAVEHPPGMREARTRAGKLTPQAVAFRAAHGAIAMGFLLAIAHVWWCALSGTRGQPLQIAVAALLGEGVLVIVNRGDCPLGGMQERMGDPVPLFELILSPTNARRAVPVLGGIASAGVLLLHMRSRPSSRTA